MTLREELSKMSPREKVCVRVQNGIVYTNSVKKVKNIMEHFMEYEVKQKEVNYKDRKILKTPKKLTIIYI